jgi:sec-independent protein translocase protein TatA
MGLDNPLHVAFLVVILLLLFGAKRLPEIGRSLGSGMREFKQAVTGDGGATHAPDQLAFTPPAPTPQQSTPAPAQAPALAQAPAPTQAPAPVSEQAPAEQHQQSTSSSAPTG